MEADRDTVVSIAEIAVAFAGFGGLAGVVGRRGPETEQVDFTHLGSVVLARLVVVVASLLPMVFSRFELVEIITWRLASGLALVVNLFAFSPQNMASLYLCLLLLLLCEATAAFVGLLASLLASAPIE